MNGGLLSELQHGMLVGAERLPLLFSRTLEFLMRHLACLAGSSTITNMHAKNLAIVWAPNLLR